jgi:hypothetical protein
VRPDFKRFRSRPRWKALALLFALAVGFSSRSSSGEAATVPAELQVELLSKLAAYDRNFAARAGKAALILVIVKRDSPKSSLSAAAMKAALSRADRIGGLPHQELTVTYESAAALAALCRTKRAAIVYVTPDLESEIGAIKSSLSGIDVLSVSAIPENVPRGIVLGFEVISGKPKLAINLGQARQQRVDFKAEVLKLMKVY